jgi:hypothetical protein
MFIIFAKKLFLCSSDGLQVGIENAEDIINNLKQHRLNKCINEEPQILSKWKQIKIKMESPCHA